MTNNETFNSITGENDSPEEAAVKGLLAKIHEDYENDDFDTNYGVYLDWYHAFLDWLKSEKEDTQHDTDDPQRYMSVL